MRGLFRRKPLDSDENSPKQLNRSLGALDLIGLAIGAVIGAGIFGAVGTAAAGEVSGGEVIRVGAGPALVFSFLLLGVACAFCALCYAELAAMIPTAGSAYAYAYATLGEIVAWIIGWDLILEYAVGNIAVAISWANYMNSLLEQIGVHLPPWLTHGYGDVVQQAEAGNSQMQALLSEAPRIGPFPLLVNLPAFLIVAAITGILLLGAKESATVNNIMVLIKLLALGLFIVMGVPHIRPEYYVPFFPNGWKGIWQGAAIVFFAYIGFDAISTAAEETKNPQRNLPIGILGGLGICTLIYVATGLVLTGLAPWNQLNQHGDPLAFALEHAGLPVASGLVSAGAVISTAAVLLVFQYGQPRILFAMARDGLLPERIARLHPKRRIPSTLITITGAFVGIAASLADDDATYDLTNIGTLFAFFIVCIGVLILRVIEPLRPRPFRVPAVWLIAPAGALSCLFIMAGLPAAAWRRFGLWLLVGLIIYFAYGMRHSKLRLSFKGSPCPPT
ncbi:MAG: amino acid permease, partial [Deltaproteobacteria bacterium]|nr:amino acid permease [Deltaproteobacteria bacterium]